MLDYKRAVEIKECSHVVVRILMRVCLYVRVRENLFILVFVLTCCALVVFIVLFYFVFLTETLDNKDNQFVPVTTTTSAKWSCSVVIFIIYLLLAKPCRVKKVPISFDHTFGDKAAARPVVVESRF